MAYAAQRRIGGERRVGGGVCQQKGPRNLGSTTEPSVPTSSSPRGRGGMYRRPVSGRAPKPEGPLDLGHNGNMGFISPTLQKSRKHPSASTE